VALVVELKSGAFLRRSEHTVRSLLDRLRAIRIVQAEEIEILIAGERVEPSPTARSLPLPHPAHPTVVVWSGDRDGDGGWDELQASTSAVTQLLHQPSLQGALNLVLVKLQRHLGGEMPDHIDDRTLALSLDTTSSRDPPQSTAGTESERDLRESRGHPPPRTPGPHADLQPSPCRGNAGRVHPPLQRPPPHQARRQLPPDIDQTPTPATVTDLQTHKIRRQSVLGGLINEDQRTA
jgi:hypothetical protein